MLKIEAYAAQTFKKDLPAMGELHHSFLESFLTDYIYSSEVGETIGEYNSKITNQRILARGIFLSYSGACITLATQGNLIKKNPPNTVLTTCERK
jgi:hypothetical protein